MAKKLQKSVDYYNLIVEISLILLIISVPCFIDLRLSGVMIGKLALMQFFSGIILLTWLVKFYLSNQVKFFHSKFDLPFLFFLIISIAATAFSKNPYLSLVGAYYRYEGLITLINYLFLFYVVVNFLNEDSIDRVLNIIVFTGGLVGFYGLMQHLNKDLVGWGVYDSNRVFSTFGNPVYLGAYTATLLPLAVGMCLKELKSQKRTPSKIKNIRDRMKQLFHFSVAIFIKISPWLYGISLSLILSGLCLSRGRGAFIAVIISLLVFFCLCLKTREIFITKKLVVTLIILLLVGGYFNLNLKTSSLGRVLQMVNKTISGEADNNSIPTSSGEKTFTTAMKTAAGARPIMWRDALRIIKDYPLLGIGPETFGLIYPKYRSLELILTEGGQYGRPDRVHNDIIDLTLSKGLLGLGAYLWMLFVFFGLSFKGALSKDRLVNISLFAAGLSYFIQNQFCFWIIPSTSIFFILCGLVAKLNTSTTSYLLLPKFPSWIKLIICLVIIIPAIAIGKLTRNFYLADLEFKQGNNLYFGGAVIDSIPKFEKALLLNPYERHYYEYILHAYLDTAQTMKENLKKAIEAGERATKLYPQDTIFHNLLGVAYSNDGQLDKTILEYQKVLEFDPFFSDVRGKLGAIYINQNRYDKAIEVYKQGLEVNPRCSLSIENLAKIYTFQGKTEEAKRLLKRLVQINPDNFEAHNNLARIYYDEGNIPAVINECKEMIRIDPKNIEAHKNLGSIYFKQRLFYQSYLEFTKVLEIDPENTYAKNILGMIELRK